MTRSNSSQNIIYSYEVSILSLRNNAEHWLLNSYIYFVSISFRNDFRIYIILSNELARALMLTSNSNQSHIRIHRCECCRLEPYKCKATTLLWTHSRYVKSYEVSLFGWKSFRGCFDSSFLNYQNLPTNSAIAMKC